MTRKIERMDDCYNANPLAWGGKEQSSAETQGGGEVGRVEQTHPMMGSGFMHTFTSKDRLPEGTPIYAAPPSAPVGGSLVQTALRNLPQYIGKSGLVGPDKHSAMQCFEVLRDALAQQPAAVSEAMVERLANALAIYERRRTTMQSLASAVGDFLRYYRAAQPTSDPLVEWANSPLNFTATVGVFKDGVQPAAVDGEMERDARYWRTLMSNCKRDHIWYHVLPADMTEKYDSIEAVLDALATQPGGSDDDR